MVKIADIEGLFKKYLEENRFECADALYLCAKFGKEKAAEILRIRYKIAAPLTSVLEDVKQLGIDDPSSWSLRTEDTGEYINEAIIRTFERLCLSKLIENIKKKINNLSMVARGILFLVSKIGSSTFKHLDLEEILRLYELIFKEKIGRASLRRVFEELVECGIFQSTDKDYAVPDYFDLLLPELERFLPKIEVSVHWPKSK